MARAKSVWERLFCTQQCHDCSIADPQDQMSESNADEDSMPGIDVENLPPMNYFALEGNTLKITGSESFPWAGAGGPPRQEALMQRRVPDFEFSFRGVSAAPSISFKRPTASVNPLSRFGFITATFPADRYLPDAGDPVDVELARTLIGLDRSAATTLMLRRLAPRRYEIDGTLVSVHWALPGQHGLVVREDAAGDVAAGSELGDDTARPDDVPLLEYLQQAARIAERMCPQDTRTLTFPDACVDDRFQSMEIACKQARLREQEAEATRRRAASLVSVEPMHPIYGTVRRR